MTSPTQATDWTSHVQLIPARDIVAGMALVVRTSVGISPWIGPMIDTVTAGSDVVAIHTVNGGGRVFGASDMVHVIDQLAPRVRCFADRWVGGLWAQCDSRETTDQGYYGFRCADHAVRS